MICFDSNNHICDCQILAVVKQDFNHKFLQVVVFVDFYVFGCDPMPN
ncbi:hypothetical protein VCHA56P521_10601 [Vibrio chagasii]|nr:hypothetical protein VCHA37P191_10028 [Vibrio chagasii]CAH7168994.1 hypothetical protein VCHA50O387_20089 [Vibrio chagasii]CAH7209289.1 hypothetical protein VCHA50O402_30590 [Vibrio chagasii]CAH7213532.1 hypothetical protein VCHA43P282_30034 [Vibrio chagasii]CAH7314365.1 hypothetical protein VCHA56P521_10601 [Vibrio chagasii]